MVQTSVKEHNQDFIKSLESGDIIRFPRGLISHFGIYEGGQNVIHLSKDKDHKVSVRRDNFFEVCENSKAEKHNYLDHIFPPREKEDIIDIACSKIGDKGYNPLFNNCEHFATYCRNNISWSQQSHTAISLLAVIILIVCMVIAAAFIIGWFRSQQGKCKREEENPFFFKTSV